jgi:uncharacterized damage-inducible protein DinB
MKSFLLHSSLLLIFSATALAQSSANSPQAAPSQTTPPPAAQANQAPATPASVMDRSLSGVEKEFVTAAEAMPEDKFSFAPTTGEFKGVRTFAQQVKHVAAVNYMVFAAMLGEKAPDTGGENGPDSLKTKAEIVKYLKESFLLGHRAMAGMTPDNLVEPIANPFGPRPVTRLALGNSIVGHCFDHYGQMVVYLRMNGIVPPASRGQ